MFIAAKVKAYHFYCHHHWAEESCLLLLNARLTVLIVTINWAEE